MLNPAVAYVMDKVDFVLLESEAVVESGDLVNAVGSSEIAIIARSASKPFYALAESYKFHHLFPLSQYDLPIYYSKNTTTDPQSPPTTLARVTQEQISENNAHVDYTRCDYGNACRLYFPGSFAMRFTRLLIICPLPLRR
ncbi:hypothetical protein H1R20_g15180, partial [Candolleomyces eurysporus]